MPIDSVADSPVQPEEWERRIGVQWLEDLGFFMLSCMSLDKASFEPRKEVVTKFRICIDVAPRNYRKIKIFQRLDL